MSHMVDLPFLFSLCASLAFAQTPVRSPEQPEVQLRLSIDQPTKTVGQPFAARVEISNRGQADFFVGRYMHPTFTNPSYVLIRVEDENGNPSTVELWTELLTPAFLAEWWIPLAPGHTLGVELQIDSSSHAFLKSPGRYKVTAEYMCAGETSGGRRKKETPIWRGKLLSNSLWIEVRPEEEKPAK